MNIIKLLVAIFICLVACESGAKINVNDSVQSPARLTSIMRGNELDAASPVVFYYDSLRKSLINNKTPGWTNSNFPEVMFVPGWGEWICNEEEFGHKAIVTDTVSGDDDVKNSEYEEYLSQSEYEVVVNENYLKIESSNSLKRKYLYVAEVKLFRDSKNAVILGIQTSESAEENYTHNYEFFILAKGKWEKTIIPVQDIDSYAHFFSGEVDEEFLKANKFFGTSFDFDHPGDTLFLKPYLIIPVDCNDTSTGSSGISATDKTKLCGYLQYINWEGIPYAFDRSNKIFRRADPIKKIKTN